MKLTLTDRWLMANHELSVAKKAERALRNELLSGSGLKRFASKEGTHHITVDDHTLTVVNRKLLTVKDTAKLEKYLDELDSTTAEIYDPVFIRKYTVDKAAHSKLDVTRQVTLRRFLQKTDAATQLKLRQKDDA